MGCRFCERELVSSIERKLESCVVCLEQMSSKVVALTSETSELRRQLDEKRTAISDYLIGVEYARSLEVAEHAGREAHRRGLTLDDDPYVTDESVAWTSGWIREEMVSQLISLQQAVVGTAGHVQTISELARGGADPAEICDKLDALLDQLVPYLPIPA